MGFRLFLDANFLLDLTLQRKTYSEVRQVMQAVIDRKAEATTSPAVLHITSYFLRKSYDSAAVKNLIATLLKDVSVIDCSHEAAVLAVNSSFDDLEDALQYFSALEHRVEYFISADAGLKNMAFPQLPVLTAAEVLDQMNF